jgi:hypothetical protein
MRGTLAGLFMAMATTLSAIRAAPADTNAPTPVMVTIIGRGAIRLVVADGAVTSLRRLG